MKAIVKSIMMIAMVAVMTVGATGAVWSDEATSEDNTFATGNADLQISRGSGYQDSVAGFTASNLYPGWDHDYSLWLRNNSTAPISLDVVAHFENLGGSYWGTDASLPDKVYVQFFQSDGTTPVTGRWTVRQWVNGSDHLEALAQNEAKQYVMRVDIPSSAGNEIQNSDLSFDAVFVGTQL